jgi:hypothetical protein
MDKSERGTGAPHAQHEWLQAFRSCYERIHHVELSIKYPLDDVETT